MSSIVLKLWIIPAFTKQVSRHKKRVSVLNLFTFTILFLSFTFSVFSQQKWYSKFGWWGVDVGYDVVETLDGHFMITGYTGSYTNGNSDVLLTKVHKDGWPMWTKNIGGTNNDVGKALVRTADSGFVIVGYTNSYGNGGYDGLLIKVKKTGEVVWQRTFGNADWDVLNALQQTSDNGFVMVGYSYSNSKGAKDMWVVKTDSLGNMQWEKRLGGILDDEFVSVEVLHDNRIACFGNTYSFSDPKGNMLLYKTNNNGDSLFFKEVGNANKTDVGYDFFERPTDSSFVLCGSTQSPYGSDTMYYYQLILDSVGNMLADIKETKGNLKNQAAYTNAFFNGYKHYVIYDLLGFGQGKHEAGFYVFSSQWYITGTTYGSSEDDYLYSCKKTSDKGVVAVGITRGFNAMQEDVFVVKLDSTLQSALNVVSVENFSEKIDFRIYPNMASEHIYFESVVPVSSAELVIQDIQGKIVYQDTLNTSFKNIDIRHLEDGLYFLTVLVKGYRYTGKFIKQSLR